MEKALIFDIQRMSTEDGTGIRTTVFFKGCNLNCLWCHNPESISFKPHLFWHKEKCMGCLACKNCPAINTKMCKFCGKCAKNCPCNALEIKGVYHQPEKLVKELLKDEAFFAGGGGVTFGGGEAMLFTNYLKKVMPLLKQHNIHIAIDTAGLCAFNSFEEILNYTDLILFDIKLFDPAAHLNFTKTDNALILENAKKLGAQTQVKVWVRTPIVPNATDSVENISAIGAFIKENMPNVERWELVAFNNLCKNKYDMLGKAWHYQNAPLVTKDTANKLLNEAKKYTNKAMLKGFFCT
jgi:pyruvate formate lyase activating enzyme